LPKETLLRQCEQALHIRLSKASNASRSRHQKRECGWTYFSQHFGASFTSKSIVISPAEVSSRTDIVYLMIGRCRSEVEVDHWKRWPSAIWYKGACLERASGRLGPSRRSFFEGQGWGVIFDLIPTKSDNKEPLQHVTAPQS
jgi:hypothetical protein